MNALRPLLTDAIDYAGLFPPAALSMEEAVRTYAKHRAEPESFALGRFVLPVAQLAVFAEAASPLVHDDRWPLSVLAAPTDAATIAAFNARYAPHFVIDTVEGKASTVAEIESYATLDEALTVFVEIPIAEDPAPLIAALAAHGLRAKVRTGGVVPGAFPPAADVARFLVACAQAQVPCKATAGLHHPVRGAYRLTYAADAVQGTMFGFLNVTVAMALARRGADEEPVIAALEETDPASFRVDATRLQWRDTVITGSALRDAADEPILPFGSCSFAEPMADLHSLGFL